MAGRALSERVRGAQMRTLYAGMPPGVIAAASGALLLGLILDGPGGPPRGPLWTWVGLVIAEMAAHLLLCLWFSRARPPDAAWRLWARRFTALSLAEGLTWGAGAVWMAQLGLDLQQFVLVILMLAGAVGGAGSVIGAYLPAFDAFVLPITLPYMAWAAFQPAGVQRTLLFYFIIYTLVAVVAARRGFARAIVESLRLRFENTDLLDGLRIARDRAEQASLDKSRFLAAASHDLRQPVHALGMFVGALRPRVMDARARELVGQIEGSVAALEGLFDALLDISQLDAGAVEPRMEVFPLRPLLDRVGRDYAPQAAAKGLALRVAPCSAWVRADPVLLERVVRNLADNAVRYTARGRVLIGARRAGGLLRVAVWDTGPGIAEAQQERVFQEFFQVGNAARDRGQGIGLGLAIVRRLARLMDCEVALRSVPGRGTMIGLSVPAAPHGADVARLREAASAPASDLRGLVLVIDDEAAIRSAMRSLLCAWGLDVVAAGSGAEMLEAMADLPAVPRLIVCDYWLPGGEDGVTVIERLRAEFNEDVPALLITGDVRPQAAELARLHGASVLHKPVAPARLRALIAAPGEPLAPSSPVRASAAR